MEWSAKWQVDANTPPNVKFYVTDEFLPYWVQCTQEGCGKWRRLPFGVELCGVNQSSVQCIDCNKPEEKVWCGVCHRYFVLHGCPVIEVSLFYTRRRYGVVYAIGIVC